MKKVAVFLRKAPYGSVYAAEGLRSVMGIAIFEMDAHLIFADDGVYTLVKGQDPKALEMQPLGEGFAMLPEFGATKFYVHRPSLEARGLKPEDLTVEALLVDDAGVASILAECGIVLPF